MDIISTGDYNINENDSGVIFIILSDSLSGGAGTLSLRMSKWLVEEGYEVIFFCKKIDNEDIFKEMITAGIIVHCIKTRKMSNVLAKYKSSNYFIGISYFLKNFIEIEMLKKDFKIIKNWLYIVHFEALIWGNIQIPIIKNYFISRFKKIVERLDMNDSIIFMDNISLDFTEKYYNIIIDKTKEKIVRIPMFIDKQKIEVNKKRELRTFNILTIGRADFPFKGYIIGLIEDFLQINKKYKNTRLTIITYGRDINKIEEKLKKVEQNGETSIELVKGVSNSELGKYFMKTHLYIGMGTTILEAAIHSTPSIIVDSYTYENLTCGFFHENKEHIGVPYDVKMQSKPFIEKIINMSYSEYEEISSKSYDAVVELYNIDKNIKKFIDCRLIKESSILSEKQIYFYKLYYLAGQLIVKMGKMIKKIK